MTVVPIFSGGAVRLVCTNGHDNPATLAAITRPPAGASSPFVLIGVTCPNCEETSFHPVTGGADQASVQGVFMAAVAAVGCPCGALTAGKAATLVRAHLRQHAQAFGGDFIA